MAYGLQCFQFLHPLTDVPTEYIASSDAVNAVNEADIKDYQALRAACAYI